MAATGHDSPAGPRTTPGRVGLASVLTSLRTSVWAVALTLTLTLSGVASVHSATVRLTATSGPVFDGFDGPSGSAPDSRFWTIDPANTAGFASGEVANYSSSPDNIHLDGRGHLVIQAMATPTGYTTGRLSTRGKVDMLFGRVEARMKLPAGYALWPTFVLVGTDLPAVGWPQAGELDIAEMINDSSTFHVTLHAPRGGGVTPICPNCMTPGANFEIPGHLPVPMDLSQDFHVYWASWQFDAIQVGVDDMTLATYTPAMLGTDAQWVFNSPMYAYLQLAVGSTVTGPPNATTPLPAKMLVDWFRYSPN
ncbi:glycoside hydrolase family 16 protein [Mycolicibacterium sp.]|uniref:glycoside hydrolase family 16 protein n=1 Tax=Mycolicibacterium sp. TaxID=2320850 RepID=UPI001A1E2E60|nr:glycoside hydrolase family 16 protein [Mycolicibacterium sp.]MBJ7339109.1 glycoside hydrolase family 16 protein [Mycolicibacterium sp.]